MTIKEEEIRPEALFSEFIRLSAEDAENFFSENDFEAVPCPACGATEIEDDGFVKHSFHYEHCASCGSVYVTPRPTPEALLRYYATSHSQKYWSEVILKHTGEKRKESIVMPALARVDDIMRDIVGLNPKTVLDVGAANGAFLSEWKNSHPETELIAIEPGEEPAQKCREQGMTVFEGFLEEEAGKDGAAGDLVTCFEVLEHVQNPEAFCKAMYDVTAPGGVSIMSCLGVDGFDIQLLWGDSRSFAPPYHLNFMSKKGMELMLSKAGFDRVEILTPGRLDVEIVQKSIERGIAPDLSRFEKLLLSRGEETLKAFQQFLASHALSSHVWIIGYRN